MCRFSTLANLYSFETECLWTWRVLQGSWQNSFSVQFPLVLKRFLFLIFLIRSFALPLWVLCQNIFQSTLIYQEPVTGRCIWPFMLKTCIVKMAWQEHQIHRDHSYSATEKDIYEVSKIVAQFLVQLIHCASEVLGREKQTKLPVASRSVTDHCKEMLTLWTGNADVSYYPFIFI